MTPAELAELKSRWNSLRTHPVNPQNIQIAKDRITKALAGLPPEFTNDLIGFINAALPH
jgi:hypothetical protein